jgi:hypothetical protein
MTGSSKDDSGPRAEDVASYVAAMALELKGMVEPHDLRPLAYLLDLVRLEAEERAGGKPDRHNTTKNGG